MPVILPTLAIKAFPLVHVPLLVPSLKVVVAPTATVVAPLIADGVDGALLNVPALVAVALQPLLLAVTV